MESFKIISEIEYKGKSFYILINRANQKYFLKKVEDGSMMYPTMDEFIELYSVFNKVKFDYALLDGFRKKFEFVPQVIKKIGKEVTLISLSVAISIAVASCGISSRSVEPIPAETSEYASFETMNTEEKYEYLGYKFEQYEGYKDQRFYRLLEYIDYGDNRKVIHPKTFTEFAELIGTEISPSFETTIETLVNNPNIPDDYKEILKNGLERLSEKLPDMDLTILNYNLCRMEIIKTTLDDLKELTQNNYIGMFNPETGKVYFIEDEKDYMNQFTLLHECLGHASTEADIKMPYNEHIDFAGGYDLDTLEVWASNYNFTLTPYTDSDGKEYLGFGLMGFGLEEGKADMIADKAMEGKILGGSYEPADETLRIMLDTLGISITDFINGDGIYYLNSVMQQNNIQDSLRYIISMDVFDDCLKEAEIRITEGEANITQNIVEFILDYADDKIKSGEMTKEEMVQKCTELFENSSLDVIHVYLDYLENINMEDLESQVIDEINDMGEK